MARTTGVGARPERQFKSDLAAHGSFGWFLLMGYGLLQQAQADGRLARQKGYTMTDMEYIPRQMNVSSKWKRDPKGPFRAHEAYQGNTSTGLAYCQDGKHYILRHVSSGYRLGLFSVQTVAQVRRWLAAVLPLRDWTLPVEALLDTVPDAQIEAARQASMQSADSSTTERVHHD